jgi:uroporphyrinogen decarboxylase
MNRKARMMTALSLGEPDRVPVWELAFNEESIIKIGRLFTDEVPPLKLVHEMDLAEKLRLLDLLYLIAGKLELDGLTSIYLDETKIIDAGHIKDNWGRVYFVGKEGEAIPVQGPVSGPDDLKHFKFIHPQDSEFIMLMMSTEKLGKDVAHVFHMTGPFRESWATLGAIEKLLYFYKKKPDFVKDLARMGTDHILEVIDRAAKLGADVIALVSDLAFNTSTLMSPAQHEQFLLPYHKEIVAHAHGLGMKIILHSDGNLWPIMDQIVEAGFNGLHPIQPQCMNIGEVKAKHGKHVCLLGNIDCEHLLPFGSEADVDKAVKETIAVAAPGGGYIISSSNTVHPGCKAENYVALVKAARKYGNYPLQSSAK